jgi:hypothetical protein
MHVPKIKPQVNKYVYHKNPKQHLFPAQTNQRNKFFKALGFGFFPVIPNGYPPGSTGKFKN